MADATDDEFVVSSELVIPEEGAAVLEEAFQRRLQEVDGWPGFRRLEVWRDAARPGSYLMVSWWASRDDFVSYMRSDAHRRSHDRIPTEPHRPAPVGVRRWDVVAR